MSDHLLVINPGSTSTKVAIFDGDKKLSDMNIRHEPSELSKFDNVADQFNLRMTAIENWLNNTGVEKSSYKAIIGRGAPLKPLSGGSYSISEEMITDLKSATYSNHASNLGALLASYYGKQINVPSLISDPITVDNFTDIARISGVPEIQRKCRVHALNIKEVCRREAKKVSKQLNEVSFVAVHMGGGVSVAALKFGKVVDVNDALIGMGPFSPDRAGALPIGGLVKLCFSGKYTEQEMIDKLSRKSGLYAYLGESDLREVEKMIDSGDKNALLHFNAMAYQIAKEIGIMATVLKGEFEAIVLTGGMAHSTRLVNEISSYVSFIKKILVVPGEFEMEALAAAGMRFLSGEDELQVY